MKRKSVIWAMVWGFALAGVIVGVLPIPKVEPPKTEEPIVAEKMQGMWVATVSNLDFPSQPDATQAQLRQELDTIVADAVKWGMNTIIFQVRPNCDALYESDLFPVSSVLSSTGELPEGFDPLDYICQIAHEAGLELHAWINPLRVSTTNEAPTSAYEEWVVEYAEKLYFDPGEPAVRKLVVDGVSEIISRYEVDGIHFDDYFYPYPAEGQTFDDTDTYETYGEGKELADWRRENITDLIRQTQAVIKESKKDISFGVAPFAVWQNVSSDELGSDTRAGVETFSDLYADTRTWVKEGLVDYICPQIYWSFEQEAAPFAAVFDWWADCVADTDVALIVGHAFYKQGTDQAGWDDARQTIRQVQYASQNEQYDGSLFFRYGNLKANPDGATEIFIQETQTTS